MPDIPSRIGWVGLGKMGLPMAANLLAAVITHRAVRASPLRQLAPGWESWSRGWDFPMGLSLGATLIAYLGIGIFFGA